MKTNLLKLLKLSIDLDKFYNIEVTPYSIRLQGYYTAELESEIKELGYNYLNQEDDFMRYELGSIRIVLTGAPIECPDCDGSGKLNDSPCCGASYDSDVLICMECKEHIGENDLKCESCDGKGTL